MVSFGSPTGRPHLRGTSPGTATDGRQAAWDWPAGGGVWTERPGRVHVCRSRLMAAGDSVPFSPPSHVGVFLLREWERKTHAGWVWIDTTALQSSASGSCDRTGTRARTAAGLGRLCAEGRSVLVSGRRRVPTGLSLHRGGGVAGGQHRALAGGLWDPARGRGQVTEGAGGRAGTG